MNQPPEPLFIYQTKPEPDEHRDLQQYVERYLKDKDERQIELFLHFHESAINKTVKKLVIRYAMHGHFSKIKSVYVDGIWLALQSYDLKYDVPFLAYMRRIVNTEILDYIRVMRTGFTVPTADQFLVLRKIMRLFHENGGIFDDNMVSLIADELNMLEKTVRDYLESGLRSQALVNYYQEEYEDENGNMESEIMSSSIDDPERLYIHLERHNTLFSCFDSLSLREQDIFASRLGFCIDCHGRKEKLSYQEIATNHELSSANAVELSSANAVEVAYGKARDKLIFELVGKRYMHCLHLKQKQKIAKTITYLYQVDHDGDWGEIIYHCKAQHFEVLSLADLDYVKSRPYARLAIHKIRNMIQSDKLLKERLYALY